MVLFFTFLITEKNSGTRNGFVAFAKVVPTNEIPDGDSNDGVYIAVPMG